MSQQVNDLKVAVEGLKTVVGQAVSKINALSQQVTDLQAAAGSSSQDTADIVAATADVNTQVSSLNTVVNP